MYFCISYKKKVTNFGSFIEIHSFLCILPGQGQCYSTCVLGIWSEIIACRAQAPGSNYTNKIGMCQHMAFN